MRRISPALLLLTFAACGDDPPSPKDVRAAIHDDLHSVLTEGTTAMNRSTANLPTLGMVTMPTLDVDPDALTNRLETELFTDTNYLGNGIYRVPASMLCTDATDSSCAAKIDKLQLRIRVASESDAIRFYVQIDPNHDEPLSLLLSHDELAVTLNLDDASAAMVAIAALDSTMPPNAQLAGQVTASLTILGPSHAQVALSIDRALSIKLADEGVALDSASAFRFTSAAAKVIALELDGGAPKAKLALGLGETTAHIPSDTGPARDLALGGATLTASYQGNTLSLDNLSLGTKSTTLAVDGQVAQKIDLNANDGRKLSATITSDPATGAETIAVSPKFDLQMTVDHALLGDAAPIYDTTRVLLDGTLRMFEGSDVIEVVTGSFSTTTNPAQYGFAASAGQCVTRTTQTDPATFEDYSTYSVGTCL